MSLCLALGADLAGVHRLGHRHEPAGRVGAGRDHDHRHPDHAAQLRQREHLLDLIGLDTITWECDYPHSDSTWPHSPETLWKSLDGFPDAEIDTMTHGNGMRHCRCDPFRHVPRAQATVAARRAMLGRYARAQAARK